MKRLGILMWLAGALVALPGSAEGQRGEPTTTTRSELVQYDITCDLKVFAKNPDGTEKQILDKGSWVWSGLTPPRVYAMVFVRNAGRLGVSVQSSVFLQTPTEQTAAGWLVGPTYFVNASGTKTAEHFTPVVTVPANSLATLGPYWLKNEPSAIRYTVTTDTDSNQHIREINETNNKCSSSLTIIAPAR